MMQKHTVRQGECISSIADLYGFYPDTLWNHTANTALKGKRRDGYLLAPGDVLTIPDKEEKQMPGGTEAKHRFRRKGIPETLRLVIEDEAGKPRQNLPYVLSVDGELHQGNTDGDGMIEVPILPGAAKAKLTVGAGDEQIEYDLELGALDPVSEDTGVQGRLRNLGYDCGPADGDIGERTKRAVSQFQQDQGLEPTGEIDDVTRQKLEAVHDETS